MMSEREEYTPDTGAVRAAYTRAMRQAFIASTSEHIEEFDRWLAAHDRAIREQIAREIEAFGDSSCVGAYGDYGPPAIAVSDAARIARGEGSE